MEPLSAANTRFFLNLFKEISEGKPSENVFYSPVSNSSVLEMASLAARGNTADQMNKVLGFKGPGNSMTPGYHVEKINSSYKKFMSELNKPGVPYVLSLYNRLYGEQSYEFVEEFLDDAKIYNEAGLEKVDFKTESEAARVNINNREKMEDLLPMRTVKRLPNLALVNAIYFNGNWVNKFPKEATTDGLFKLNKTQTKPVKMMHQKNYFRLASIPEMNSQILELPYVGTHSMLIILPNKIEDDTTGLLELENALISELREWTKPSNMRHQEVQVSLPRFTTEDSKNSKESVSMEDDRQKVNHSGMSPNKGLVVSKLIHKAFVKVNEEGTIMSKTDITKTDCDMNDSQNSKGKEVVFDQQKVNLSGMTQNNDLEPSKWIHEPFVEVNEEGEREAAAAGAIRNLTRMASTSPPATFNVDHPFLFFIRHNPSNAILFYGRVCSP